MELRELVTNLINNRSDIFGYIYSNEVIDFKPAFECDSNKKFFKYNNCKRYELLEGFSVDCNDGFIAKYNVHEAKSDKEFIDRIITALTEKIDSGTNISIFAWYFELTDKEAKENELPNEFDAEAIILKDNNEYKLKYVIEDDNGYILVTDDKHSKFIENKIIERFKN